MRMFKFFTLVLLLLAGFQLRGTAQNVTLVVTTTQGQEQSYQLTDASQLFFENGDRLVIQDGTGTTAPFQLADIRKLVHRNYFSERKQRFGNPVGPQPFTRPLHHQQPAKRK